MNVLLQFIHQKLTNATLCAGVCLLYIFSGTLVYAAEDTKLPVNISADTVSFDNKIGVATYSGNVHVIQGTRNLYANKLSIYRDVNNQIKVMIATGKPAKFKTETTDDKPASHGQAKTIKYYPQQDKVDLFEDAKLYKNGDTIEGPKLSYNFVTEILRGDSSKQQRTTVILQPKRAQ